MPGLGSIWRVATAASVLIAWALLCDETVILLYPGHGTEPTPHVLLGG
ncbi:hypothetical protein GCM10007853_25180 [Algimonas ampicilliniresistens]|uniref:Uncharacterized protein n=1 Tax=Algimonas ampicilliniresistens TaxID=1298735 RepID=A0ABQ5VD71_9PROT|nr:hypothetical protein GCM10007853_25180 [Algimonas ampicilliniresistens]